MGGRFDDHRRLSPLVRLKKLKAILPVPYVFAELTAAKPI